MKKIKLLELFGGYGSQSLALKNIGFDVDSTLCEIDKYATATYNMLHGETKNIGDICKVDTNDLDKDYDLITYSFPCTDISIAGKQEGLGKGTGTRSSLLWECERIIRELKPKYLLMENVKNLISKKFMPFYEEWLKTLEELGYKNYWQVLDARDYGIPQSRNRVFCVSILGDHDPFCFPEKKELTLKLKDLLESKVSEKYFLSKKVQDRFHYTKKFGPNTIGSTSPEQRKIGQRDVVYNTDSYIGALVATDNKQPKQIMVETSDTFCFEMPNGKKAEVDVDSIVEPTFFKEVRTEQGKLLRKIARQQTGRDTTSRDKDSKKFVVSNNKVANCLTTSIGAEQIVVEPILNNEVVKSIAIRKLTPRECWRLMGVKDYQFDKIKGISDNQLYKMAGNSIVVDVLEAIFKQMF